MLVGLLVWPWRLQGMKMDPALKQNVIFEIGIETLAARLAELGLTIEVENDHFFTYVKDGGALLRREVKTGQFNDEFIEIKSGLALGEEVALALPKRQNLESNPEPLPASPTKKQDDGKGPAKEKKNLAAVAPPVANP